MDETIKDDVFAEIRSAVDEKINNVIDPQGKNDHVVGELNFLRAAQISNVVEEITILASYGEIQFDCDCETNKRIDFQLCEPIEGRDVSSSLEKHICTVSSMPMLAYNRNYNDKKIILLRVLFL